MARKTKKVFYIFPLIFLISLFSIVAFSEAAEGLLEVTQAVEGYALKMVRPVFDGFEKNDRLSQLLKVSEIIRDSKLGIQINAIEPKRFIIYDKLEILKLGVLYTYGLSSEQKQILKNWHLKFMQKNPADVFFGPSADDIVRTRAAFGCTHYARSFIAVVKALGLVQKPEDLRYVISSKADDYNKALKKNDKKMTINGHQFVMVNIGSKWIAINTSRSEWTPMPAGFSPDAVLPPKNIPIKFESYPEVTFLLRKVGKDFNDDCRDNTLVALMNIYRSGKANISEFLWEKFKNN